MPCWPALLCAGTMLMAYGISTLPHQAVHRLKTAHHSSFDLVSEHTHPGTASTLLMCSSRGMPDARACRTCCAVMSRMAWIASLSHSRSSSNPCGHLCSWRRHSTTPTCNTQDAGKHGGFLYYAHPMFLCCQVAYTKLRRHLWGMLIMSQRRSSRKCLGTEASAKQGAVYQ